MSEAIVAALAKQGLYAGFNGLEGLRSAGDFWERQMYGTRLYYGPGGMDYLHHSALDCAIKAIEALQPENEKLLAEIERLRAELARIEAVK